MQTAAATSRQPHPSLAALDYNRACTQSYAAALPISFPWEVPLANRSAAIACRHQSKAARARHQVSGSFIRQLQQDTQSSSSSEEEAIPPVPTSTVPEDIMNELISLQGLGGENEAQQDQVQAKEKQQQDTVESKPVPQPRCPSPLRSLPDAIANNHGVRVLACMSV